MSTKWFDIQVGKRTDAGCTRGHNEDALACHRPGLPRSLLAQRGRLFVVADGVGGRRAGEVASHYAVQRLQEIYYGRGSVEEIPGALMDSVAQVNRELHEKAWSEPSLNRMATTLVCTVVHGQDLYVGNVGDSRAYLIRAGIARRITQDHSVAMELARLGRITEKAALDHPFRCVLSRSLGKGTGIQVDTFHVELQAGDTVLLCSDGLWGQVSEDELSQIAGQSQIQQAADELVALTNKYGAPDNVSVILLRMREPEPAPKPTKERAAERMTRFMAQLLDKE